MAVNISCGRNDELPIVFVDFSQDFSSLCVGTRSGYSLLGTTNDEVTETFSADGDPMCMVGRLFTSSLVTLVSLNDMRKLLVFHYRRNTLICDYRYSHTILAVKMNRQRLVVCVEDGIFIHSIRDMEMLHKVEETPPNRNGVIALSSSPDTCFLAYPGSHRVGVVFIFDALKFSNIISIAAHDGLLASLAFNSTSTMLATASERGTVVRVFSIPQGDKLMEFRRGLARCASICSLAFSLDNYFLVAASNTETVHIFKLDTTSPRADGLIGVDGVLTRPSNLDSELDSNISGNKFSENTNPIYPVVDKQPGQTGWTGGLMQWVGGAIKATAAYLPHQVSEVFSQDRAFAFARIPASSMTPGIVYPCGDDAALPTGTLPDAHYVLSSDVSTQVYGLKKIAAITVVQQHYRLLVAGLDGLLHTFSIDPLLGGEAVLLRTQNLLNPNPGSNSTQGGGLVNKHGPVEGKISTHPGPPTRSYAAVCSTDIPETVTGKELAEAELSYLANTSNNGLNCYKNSDFPPITLAINSKTGSKI